jgi:hypothetical protein
MATANIKDKSEGDASRLLLRSVMGAPHQGNGAEIVVHAAGTCTLLLLRLWLDDFDNLIER